MMAIARLAASETPVSKVNVLLRQRDDTTLKQATNCLSPIKEREFL